MDMDMDIYDIATLDEAGRVAAMEAALSKLWAAQYEVATVKTGHAIALLRELFPEAGEVWFRVENSEDAGKYGYVQLVTGPNADTVLFDRDGEHDFDEDNLSPIDDYLAGAVEAGAKFPLHYRRGEYLYSLKLAPDGEKS